jgi:sugar lactone lactonase YvrE
MKRKNNINPLMMLWMTVLLFILAFSILCCDNEDNGEPKAAVLPVEAVVVNGDLSGSEGITFNSENRLFVSGESKVWEVMSDFSLQMVYESSNPSLVGLAADENGNIFVADMGPINLPSGPNDGQVIKITSTGESSVYATDIPDPNFILLRPDGSMLVSDDYDHYIYSVPAGGGAATVWLDSIVAPNGMVYSLDQTSIYVCQTFVNAGSLIPADNRVW